MKRITILICILMCLLFAAFIKAGASSTNTPVKLTLGIMDPNADPNGSVFKACSEKFAKTHPSVTVVHTKYSYSAENFIPLAKSKVLPVIFQTYYTDAQKLIESGYIADITNLLKARGWLNGMNPSIKKLLSRNGRVYGIPCDGYGLGLMINAALFKEAGIVDSDGLPIYPKTWSELAEIGKKIKDNTGKAGFCLLAMDNAAGWQFINIAWSFGAVLTTKNKDGSLTSNLDSPEAIKAMEYIKDLKWKYDILTADPTVEDFNTAFKQLGTGSAAMCIGASDAVALPTFVNGLPVKDLGLVPMPGGPNREHYMLFGGIPYMFSKSATAAQINAALDYISIMGKGPVPDRDCYEDDCRYRVNKSIPVIYRFPNWIDKTGINQETALIDKYSNVDRRLYKDYFDTVKKDGNLRLEEAGDALYQVLTTVIQAVIKDRNADVAALMKTADKSYQKILGTALNDCQILDAAMKNR